MTGNPEANIRYRLQRARDALVEANAMAAIGHWNAVVNRLYYACFYAATALLLRRGLSSSKHTGVRALLNQHFIQVGDIPADLGTLYNRLFENRREGDYADFVEFDEVDVRPWIDASQRFVAHVESLLAQPPNTVMGAV